jgi:hypothetical protein
METKKLNNNKIITKEIVVLQVMMMSDESGTGINYIQLLRLPVWDLKSLPGSVPNFYEEVVQNYSDDAFRSHFRMNRSSMQARNKGCIMCISIFLTQNIMLK